MPEPTLDGIVVEAVPTLDDADDQILEALLSMVIADEHVDPDELRTLARVYGELTGRTVTVEHLEAHARARLADPAVGYPGALGEGLSEAQRQQVLTAAFAIATADGFVLEEEEQRLTQLSQLLGLSEDAYRTMVARLMSSRPS